MTPFAAALCVAAGLLWVAVITYLWRTRDRGQGAPFAASRKPLSVPGRDAPDRPAATGPPGSDAPWWLKGGPGIPAGGSTWTDPRCDTACPQWLTGECDTLCDPRLSPPPDVPPGDTAVPGPASLPEGDGPAARPPQEAPAREPSPDPLTAARNAMAAVARLEPGEYLEHLDEATGYGDEPPFINWLSWETQARGGIPLFKDEAAS